MGHRQNILPKRVGESSLSNTLQLYSAVDFGLLTLVRLRKSDANKGNKLQFVDYQQQPKQVVGSESFKFNRCHGSFEWFFGPAKKCL